MIINPHFKNNTEQQFVYTNDRNYDKNTLGTGQIKKVNITKGNEILNVKKSKDNVIDSDYIIKNKPKVKIVREYFKNKCDSIIDEDIKQFEK